MKSLNNFFASVDSTCILLRNLFSGMALFGSLSGIAYASCSGYETVSSGAPEFRLMPGKPAGGKRAPLHLGFNQESVAFQLSYWDAVTRTVRPAVLSHLKEMPGAVYRYPGGSVSNYADLSAARGPIETRLSQKLVDWRPAEPIRFGVPEYADFAVAAGGRMWGVLNIYGGFSGKQDPLVLASRNIEGVRDLASRGHVLRWEIGNELYLPKYHTDGAEYAGRMRPTLDALRKFDHSLKPVVGLATFDTGRNKADEFNRQLVQGLAGYDVEFAVHYYYDGKPGGPPVTWAIDNLCDKIEKIEHHTGKPPAIWVTEHAKWPPGKAGDKNWKKSWNESSDLSAALSSADFLLALSQIDVVKGAFLHSLGGAKGPWVLFQETQHGKQLYSSVVLEAVRLLHKPLSSQILPTRSVSSGWKTKNLRGAFFRLTEGSLGLAAVNRGDAEESVRLHVPELAGHQLLARYQIISGKSLHERNSDSAPQAISLRRHEEPILFDADGRATLKLARFSVNRVDFVAQSN